MMELGTETGSLVNHLYDRTTQPEPRVGMGATILLWTDRQACTIVDVRRFKSGKRIGQVRELVVQRDTATRTDSNGMSDAQRYEYSPNPNGATWTFRQNKQGRWIGAGGTLLVGTRDEHYDYSF